MSIIDHKTGYLARCQEQLVPRVPTVFHDTLLVSHPNHWPIESDILAKQGAGELGWRLDVCFHGWRWVMVRFL